MLLEHKSMKMVELSIMVQKTEVFNKCFCLHVGKHQCQLTVYINGKIFFSLYLSQRRILKYSFEKSYPRSSLLIFSKNLKHQRISREL